MQNCQPYCQTMSIAFAYESHGTLGGVSTWARGGSFWSGFASGAVASFVSTSTGIMTAEGVASVVHGCRRRPLGRRFVLDGRRRVHRRPVQRVDMRGAEPCAAIRMTSLRSKMVPHKIRFSQSRKTGSPMM